MEIFVASVYQFEEQKAHDVASAPLLLPSATVEI